MYSLPATKNRQTVVYAIIMHCFLTPQLAFEMLTGLYSLMSRNEVNTFANHILAIILAQHLGTIRLVISSPASEDATVNDIGPN
jgi:hypothetical protein